MCAVSNMAVVCSPLISFFPDTLLRYCLSDHEIVPVAPVTTGITFALLLLFFVFVVVVAQESEASGHVLFAPALYVWHFCFHCLLTAARKELCIVCAQPFYRKHNTIHRGVCDVFIVLVKISDINPYPANMENMVSS